VYGSTRRTDVPAITAARAAAPGRRIAASQRAIGQTKNFKAIATPTEAPARIG
jgi:hypothetical protein